MIGALLSQATSGCSVSQSGAFTQICTGNGTLHISIAYRSILPELTLTIGALVLLAVSAVISKRSRPGLYSALTVTTGGISLAFSIFQWYDVGKHGAQATISQQIFYDRFSVLFMMVISIATILAAPVTDTYLRREGLDGVEAYVLMLMAGTGAMLMAASGGLIMLFLGLEIMSISLYVMAAYHRRRTQSGEAGLKYFILGAFSSAIFLYGVALLYGATGSTQFGEMAAFLTRNSLSNNGILLAGLALVIVGLGFKVAAVPFHFWTPDVYDGAPTPFTGYMAAVAKAAGFAGLIRVLTEALPTEQSTWRPAIWLIAVLTLLVGSVMALAQKDLKRMFAYSSISQAGYVLVGVQAGSNTGTSGALFYLFTYTFIIIGTFAVVSIVQGRGEARNDLGAIRGLSRRSPLLAGAMLTFLLAQAGIPFTSGFLAKFYVIQAAVQRGQYPLAVIAMLTAAVAAFFYLRVALLMYSGRGGGVESAPAVEGVGGVGVGALVPAPAIPMGQPGAFAAGAPDPETDGGADDPATLAGLRPVLSLDGRDAMPGLREPPPEPVTVDLNSAVVLAVCAAATVVFGVTPILIDVARQATVIFNLS